MLAAKVPADVNFILSKLTVRRFPGTVYVMRLSSPVPTLPTAVVLAVRVPETRANVLEAVPHRIRVPPVSTRFCSTHPATLPITSLAGKYKPVFVSLLQE